MAKIEKKRNTAKKKAGGSRSAPVRPVAPPRSSAPPLDAHAKAWVRLLADPCNAPMVSPCYNSTGSGYFVRIRNILDIPSTAVDYVLDICPGNGAYQLGAWSWADSAGGSLGNASGIGMGSFFNSGFVGRARCVAGCVKVLYTGTELNRAGTAGFALQQGPTLIAGEAVSGNSSSWLATVPHTERIGQREMEYRWVPGPGDDNFRVAHAGSEEKPTNESNGSSIQLVLAGMTPGTVRVTWVSVWEWQPEQEVNTGIVSINKPPASNNSLNQVLKAIGDIGKFAVKAADAAPGFVAAAGTTLRMLGPMMSAI